MKYAIIVSEKDKAGMNIFDKLVNKLPSNVSLHKFSKESVYLENVDLEIDADMFIFATKHTSKSGIRSLSVYTQGNWGKAELGGVSKELGISPASYLKKAICLLEKISLDGYNVIQECTHHGPFMSKPSIFIEIGSDTDSWQDDSAGRVIASVILQLVKGSFEYPSVVGIGGPHHTPNFKKLQLNSSYAVGHVCPLYMLEDFDSLMLNQALEKTVPKSKLVFVDWKGLKGHKERIVSILKEVGIEWKKCKDFST